MSVALDPHWWRHLAQGPVTTNGAQCFGNGTSPNLAELGRCVRTSVGAKNDNGTVGQGQADILCKEMGAETPEWD